MNRFLREERGYALVLTLLFMPVFLGLSLMIIDVSRGGNAHSDLYAAADALALAGGGELDGASDAIPRAKAAMEEISNSVSFLGYTDGDRNLMLDYDSDVSGCSGGGGDFCVIFLDEIPANDSDPIDQAWVDDHEATTSAAAQYVYVAAQSQNLLTLFPDPVTFVTGSVPIQARAVAGRKAAACGITPLFICNPFEDTELDLSAAFEQGLLNNRIIKLHPQVAADRAGPGNFAFLDLGSGAADLKAFFAGDGQDACFDTDGQVDTEPGNINAIGPAMNVRWDLFETSYKPSDYVPGKNVRKGYTNSGDVCNQTLDPTIDLELPVEAGKTYGESTYKGFPDNFVMNTPGSGEGVAGAYIGSPGWDIDEYFERNHGHDFSTFYSTEQKRAMSSFPDAPPPYNLPSRYDVHKFEYEQTQSGGPDMITGVATENGNPLCNMGDTSNPKTTPEFGRRNIQAAIVNCETEAIDLSGKTKDIPVLAVANIFMVRPWDKDAGGTIDVEIVDITGAGGLGSLETYIRVEAILVR